MRVMTLVALIFASTMAWAVVETAKVQSEQPHPLPFSKVTKLTDNELCVRRDEPTAKETCLARKTDFPASEIKKDGKLVLGPDPAQFQSYINELSKQDETVLKFLQGTLEICQDYKIANYFTAPNSNPAPQNAVSNELYALEVQFYVRGDYFAHRIFVLGEIATLADQTRYLTYKGIADYDNAAKNLENSDLWEKTFGLPYNKKSEDMPKFLKRGAGFVAPYALDYILSQKVLNPPPR